MLLVVSGPLAALAKLTALSALAECETIPDPETATDVPCVTTTVVPSGVVNVKSFSTAVAFRPQSFRGIPAVHGTSAHSTTPAIEAVEDSPNIPAKTNTLVQPLLCMILKIFLPHLNSYPRTPSVP